jgi:hypothetical protein
MDMSYAENRTSSVRLGRQDFSYGLWEYDEYEKPAKDVSHDIPLQMSRPSLNYAES